ncbi:spermine/spermidine synthase [Tenuibacillus multivorans]|uniref:Spermidine synthase n=1 Tax=Tenuibacillus multivorans TaxID=237069 RepID=A0A1H0ET57_9BACI|nr:spermine/spermidine synthase [Tenuibacillus multivorans]GEL76964.1 spermidine synthase [Tenuibacillus multivorans]SDN85540.1 Spermidine synthase [Tenuibacillus multivorans]
MYTSPKVIDYAKTSRGEIQLQQRGDEYEVISNGTFLMATYNGESEKLLVQAAIEEATHPERVLIGGLGVGFSLAEALSYSNIKEVTVIEIEKCIIEWNKTYLAEYSSNSLQDPRTNIVHADFTKWMYETQEKFDVICLDIDNGPDWTVVESNNTLYQEDSLHVLASLLNEQGVISFWSASSAPHFVARLKQIFKHVTELSVPVDRGEPDYIYLVKAGKSI